jgi:hypothetical protein
MNEHEAEHHRRQIANHRAELVDALAAARGAVREGTGGRLVGRFTIPLLAAGLGLVAALGIRRFLRR